MKSETKWAVIAAFALLIWLLLAKMLGLHGAEKFETGTLVSTIFSILLFIAVYYMVCKEKRDLEYNGIMSWAEGFWACARMTLIFIPLSCALWYLYMKSINPEYCSVFVAKMAAANHASGKDPVNDHLIGHLQAAYLFGGVFSLLFPALTKRNAA